MTQKALTGIKATTDTIADMKLIESQGLCDSGEVFRCGVKLLMALLPEDKTERKPLIVLVDDAIETLSDAKKEGAESED